MSHRNTFYYDQASNVTCVRDDDLGLTYYTYDLLKHTTSLKNSFGEGPSHKREGAYYEYLNCNQVGKRTLGNANHAVTEAGSLPHRSNTTTANGTRPGARAAARSVA